jgi:hypothetical protein
VTGPRLLVDPDHKNSDYIKNALLAGAIALLEEFAASSLHLTFLCDADAAVCAERGLLARTDRQFHWHNPGYKNFDDFLGQLSSKRRKIIRQERRQATCGIYIETLGGADLNEAHWDAFWQFYQDTSSRKWGHPYLTRAFFSMLGERMADRVVLLLAKRDGRYVAGALHLLGTDALYGRYWGCIEYHPSLHFELCYYQAIEFAIAQGLKRVEAGAQGEHKLARGYLPQITHSAHWIADPRLRAGIAHYLQAERCCVEQDSELLEAHSPFRQTDN